MKRGEENRIKVCNFVRKTYKLTGMAPPIRPNYKQTYLFPYSWEELMETVAKLPLQASENAREQHGKRV